MFNAKSSSTAVVLIDHREPRNPGKKPLLYRHCERPPALLHGGKSPERARQSSRHPSLRALKGRGNPGFFIYLYKEIVQLDHHAGSADASPARDDGVEVRRTV